MIPREYGENTTLECRAEAHEKVDKQKRRKDILMIMSHNKEPMTAWEIAYKLFFNGKISRLDRNATAPRLTEMCKDGTVEPVGRKLDMYTGKNVTCYQIRGDA